MKILVCISSVPDTTSKINFTADQSSFDKTGIQWVINPHDEYALNKAIQLKNQLGGSVTAVSVGDATAEPVLRKALAIGADDAIRVDALPQDSFSAAQELASVVKNGGYEVVLCGRESLDYNGGAVPAMLAQLVDFSFVNGAVGLEISANEATAVREIEGGKETISVKCPIVVAGQKGLIDEKDLIIPNMRSIMGARTKPLAVVEPTATEVRTQSVSFEAVAPRGAVKMFSTDQLDELVKHLHEEAKVI